MRSRINIVAAWWTFYIVVIASIVLLCSAAKGQETTWEINDFSGGVNIGSNWNFIAPNQGSFVKNVVLDDPKGALKIRPGYTKLRDTLALYTKVLSMHSHKLDNDKTYLFAVNERRDSGWAAIFASNAASRFSGGGSSALAKAKYLYPTPGFWFTWHGLDYYFNGRNRPLVFDMEVDSTDTVKGVAPMTPAAPGQLQADPLKRSGGPNGWYQYAQVIQIPCSSVVAGDVPWGTRYGVLSVPVEANSELIRVSGYTKRGTDSACVTAGTDSVWVMTLRTRGNHNEYDTDSLFIIDSFKVPNDSIPKRVLIDTTSDASLTSGRFFSRIKLITGNSRWSWSRGGHNTAYAPGSMTLLKSDTSFGGSANQDTVLGSNCFGTGVVLNNLYTFTLRDKRTGVESDTATILSVYRGGSYDKNLKFYIPPAPSNRYDRVLYRAHWVEGHNDEDAYDGDYGFQNQIFYALDTLTSDTQTTYWDTMPPCSLEVWNENYDRRVPITNYSGAIVHEGKMFAWDGEQVYFSVSDTAIFPFFNALEFDLGRGDPIVRLVSFDGYIAVYKRLSTWILYTRDGTVYDARKGNDGLGLVGPQAVASYGNTNFVVGQNGLYSEVTNPYRDHDVGRDYIDDPFPLYEQSETDLSKTVAIVYRDRLLVSYPDENKTRVYHLQTDSWVEWSFGFTSACVYDTAWGTGNYSPVLVFAKDGNCKLFSLDDTAQTDDGTFFQGYWQKKYLGINDPSAKTISEVRMSWDAAPWPDTFKVTMDVLDERSLNYGVVYFDDLTPRSFGRKYFAPTDQKVGHYFWFRVWLPSNGYITVRKIDLVAHGAGTD